MPLAAGRMMDRYRLIEKIGEGGMGVIWKALDTSLDREIAIKILPDLFSEDPDRLARFDREAKLLASLDHPNIASIYGLYSTSGDDPGADSATGAKPIAMRFIAMELLHGEDLAERLTHGPMALDDALEVAVEIARAFEAAHATGVIHRDLKPANVRRAPDGRVKVLDFGLAKALEGDPASRSGSVSLSPTMTSAGTIAGTLVGTASYMSPEQARGRSVDRRADVWAFGAVLYEMLVGRKAFDGETVAEALASVLKSEPDWDALPANTPRAVRRVLRRCLEKDPDARLHDIADARIEIEEARRAPEEFETGAAASIAATGLVARLLPWAVAIPALVAAAWFATVPRDVPSAPARRVVSSLLPPDGMGFDLSDGFALAPDGSRIAFVARDEDGVGRLWLRDLDRAEARAIAGTEGASAPFWSPDGRRLGFQVGDRLAKVEIASGLVETFADVPAIGGGATWGRAGDIVFVERRGGPLMRIPPAGGSPQPVTEIEQDGSDIHLWPSFLPDGEHFLFYVRRYGSAERMGELRLGSVDGGPSKLLFPSNSAAHFAAPGQIVWWQQGNLRAQAFDVDTNTLVGESAGLIADVRFDPRNASPAFSVSATGILVYQRAGAPSGDRLVWLDREGRETGTLGKLGSLYTPTLSPDGTRVALDISDETNRGDIWILDVRRGSATRLTSAEEDESCPVWSPDGDAIAYCSIAGAQRFRPVLTPADGSGESRVVVELPDQDLDPVDWYGQDILMMSDTTGGNRSDLYRYSVADGALHPYVTTDFHEIQATFSPDGRHVAYASDDTGQLEVYVRDFPAGGRRRQVSVGGGRMPRWNPDSSEILFLAPDNRLMAVPLGRRAGGVDFEFGIAEALFTVDVKAHRYTQWDVLDGERLLFNVEVRGGATDPLTLVQGWQLPGPP